MAQSPFDDSEDTSCSSSESTCSTNDSDTDTESDESTSSDEPPLLRPRMRRAVHVVNYNARYARWMHDAYQQRVRAEIAAFRAWCHWKYVYERRIVYDYLHVSQPPWVVAWRDSKSREPLYPSFQDSYSLQSTHSSMQPIVHMGSIMEYEVSIDWLMRLEHHYSLQSSNSSMQPIVHMGQLEYVHSIEWLTSILGLTVVSMDRLDSETFEPA